MSAVTSKTEEPLERKQVKVTSANTAELYRVINFTLNKYGIFGNRFFCKEDIRQDMAVSAMRDPEFLGTYKFYKAKMRMYDAMRRYTGRNHKKVRTKDFFPLHEDSDECAITVDGKTEHKVNMSMLLDSLHKANITEQKKVAFIKYYVDGKKMKDIAPEMGFTESAISYMVRGAREYIVKAYKGGNYGD